uniref:SH2 domain-containing protein n=1 Tax=Parastrongyloides trichosuri TaxID=131310 RepID=A0A0N4ZFW2_PARTI
MQYFPPEKTLLNCILKHGSGRKKGLFPCESVNRIPNFEETKRRLPMKSFYKELVPPIRKKSFNNQFHPKLFMNTFKNSINLNRRLIRELPFESLKQSRKRKYSKKKFDNTPYFVNDCISLAVSSLEIDNNKRDDNHNPHLSLFKPKFDNNINCEIINNEKEREKESQEKDEIIISSQIEFDHYSSKEDSNGQENSVNYKRNLLTENERFNGNIFPKIQVSSIKVQNVIYSNVSTQKTQLSNVDTGHFASQYISEQENFTKKDPLFCIPTQIIDKEDKFLDLHSMNWRRKKSMKKHKWSWLYDSFMNYLKKEENETQNKRYEMATNANLQVEKISLFASSLSWGIILLRRSDYETNRIVVIYSRKETNGTVNTQSKVVSCPMDGNTCIQTNYNMENRASTYRVYENI